MSALRSTLNLLRKDARSDFEDLVCEAVSEVDSVLESFYSAYKTVLEASTAQKEFNSAVFKRLDDLSAEVKALKAASVK
jgi:hypothetical protein